MKFGSLQHLMSFAFGVRSAVGLSAIYSMRKDPDRKKPRGEPMSRMDVLTQKGMIKSYVYRQAEIDKHHLVATFGRGRDRIDAQNKIRDWALARLPTGLHNRRMLYELVAKFYGKPVDLQAVAEHMNIDAILVMTDWGRVKTILEALQYRVDGETVQHYLDEGMIDD
jgi:hypothetical protein